MPTETQFRERFKQQITTGDLTPQQAQAQISALPIQMVYEAREALHQAKQLNLSTDEVIQLVEPVGRAIGWAEALVFAFDKTTERDAVRHFVTNGKQTH